MSKPPSKVLGAIMLCAVGVSLSYVTLAFYKFVFPKYSYEFRLYSDKQEKPRTATAPRIHVLPIGRVVPTALDEVPPATPANPIVPSAPLPLSIRESATTMAPLASTPKAAAPAVGSPNAGSTHSRNAHQGLDPPAPLAIPLDRPEFHVQAGAFKQREYADILIRQLRANGYTVTLVEGSLLRVRVGSAMNRTAAEQLVANLHSKGFEAFQSSVR